MARDGHLNEAERFSRSAIEMAIRAGLRERTAVFQAAPAVWNALYENQDAARRTAETALKTFEGRDVAYAAGFALALGGETVKAEALAERLDKEYPEDTQVQATYVPTLRALVALDKNDPRKAIDLLEANRPYEFGIPPLAFNHFYGNMYPIYVRGLAYMAMRNPAEAAVEFGRLLSHPGLAAGDPVDAAARRQLARALELPVRCESRHATERLHDKLDPSFQLCAFFGRDFRLEQNRSNVMALCRDSFEIFAASNMTSKGKSKHSQVWAPPRRLDRKKPSGRRSADAIAYTQTTC